MLDYTEWCRWDNWFGVLYNSFGALPKAIRDGLTVLAKYGSEAHLFIPGVGRVNGIDAMNFVESTFNTPSMVNTPVGGVKNASGGTINLTQATTANKPMLGIEPMGGRRNQMSNSVFAGAVSGTPGTAPTGWGFNALGGTTTVGAEAITMSASADRLILGYSFAATLNETLTFHCDIDASVGLEIRQFMLAVTNVTSQQFYIDGVAVTSTAIVLGKHRISTVAIISATGTTSFRVGVGCYTASTGTATFSKPQLERGGVVTAYQRTLSAYEAYEDGKSSIYYWQKGASAGWLSGAPLFDGTVRDYLSIASFRPSASATETYSSAFTPCAAVNGSSSGAVRGEIRYDASAGFVRILCGDGTRYADVKENINRAGQLMTISAQRVGNTVSAYNNAVKIGEAIRSDILAITPVASRLLSSVYTTPTPFQGNGYCAIAVQATVPDADRIALETMADYISGRVR